MASRITRFTDVHNEPVAQERIPIKGYEDAPTVSLEDTLKPVAKSFNQIEEEVSRAKENCQRPREGLNQEESAAIRLYTMEFQDGLSLYEVLNKNLRAENRQDLEPWFMFLKLFLTALCKLPSHEETVWRGVPGVDLSPQYPRNKKFFWWAINSCTTNPKVLESDKFLGKTGTRTLFSITCQNGKSVVRHSDYDKEEEIILMPGSYFKVMGLSNLGEGLQLIDIKEIAPPFPTVARLIEKIDALNATSKLASAKTPHSAQTAKHDPFNSIPYNITVYTGDKRNAGTDARFYIIMHHNKTSSSQISLSDRKSEQKSIYAFTIDASAELSPLTALDIGHDNTKKESGWFLDKVVVDCPRTGIKQTFPCNRWLAYDEGDKCIERRLIEDESLRETRLPTVPWYISVYTSDKKGAGTHAHVTLVLYGRDGKSDNIKLRSKSGVFEAGQCDEFTVDVTDVGIPFKLRVSHDNKKLFESWHLDRIEIENLKTYKRYTFPCGRWLSRTHDDKQTIRELPAEGSGIKKRLPVVKYMVDVYTGKQRNAGTDANVFINIIGECGDTGERPLEYSENINKFKRNQINSFVLEAVSLEQIRKIRIGHDNSGASPGWFLDKVVIGLEDQRYETATFICNRWLAVGEDDGQIVRELTLSTSPRGSTSGGSSHYVLKMKTLATTYKVNVVTSNEFGSGTNANVYIIIFGKHNDTGIVPLATSKTHSDPFEQGHTGVFEIEAMDIGEPTKIKIGHDNAGFRPDWLLERVEIDVPKLGQSWVFPCGKWLSTSKGDRQLEVELYTKDMATEVYNPLIPYEVTIYTGDTENAGCDCDVSLKLFGTTGSSSEHVIRKDEGNFERGSIDAFQCELDDVGKPIKLRVTILPKGRKGRYRWYLEKIELVKQRKHNEKEQSYFFGLNDWISHETDNHRDIPLTKDGRALVDQTTYRDITKTSDMSGAGFDAKIFVAISGQNGDSGELELKHSSTYTNN